MLKQEYSLRKLRKIMDELFSARFGGADAVRISRAQGIADGYMRALSDLGVVKEHELIALIDEVRKLAAERADERYMHQLHTRLEAAQVA